MFVGFFFFLIRLSVSFFVGFIFEVEKSLEISGACIICGAGFDN